MAKTREWVELDRAESDAVMALVCEWITLAEAQRVLTDAQCDRLALLRGVRERAGFTRKNGRVVKAPG